MIINMSWLQSFHRAFQNMSFSIGWDALVSTRTFHLYLYIIYKHYTLTYKMFSFALLYTHNNPCHCKILCTSDILLISILQANEHTINITQIRFTIEIFNCSNIPFTVLHVFFIFHLSEYSWCREMSGGFGSHCYQFFKRQLFHILGQRIHWPHFPWWCQIFFLRI